MAPRPRVSEEGAAELRAKFRAEAAEKYGIEFPSEEEISEAKANKQTWQGMAISDVGTMFSDELLVAAHLLQFLGTGYGLAGDTHSENAAHQGFNVCRAVAAEPYMDGPYRDYIAAVDRAGASIGLGNHYLEKMTERADPDLDKTTWEVIAGEEDEAERETMGDALQALLQGLAGVSGVPVEVRVLTESKPIEPQA